MYSISWKGGVIYDSILESHTWYLEAVDVYN